MDDDVPFMKVRGSVAEELTELEDVQMVNKKYIYTLMQEMIQRNPLIREMVQREIRAAVDAVDRYKDVMAETSIHADPPNAPKRRRTEARSESPTGENRRKQAVQNHGTPS